MWRTGTWKENDQGLELCKSRASINASIKYYKTKCNNDVTLNAVISIAVFASSVHFARTKCPDSLMLDNGQSR